MIFGYPMRNIMEIRYDHYGNDKLNSSTQEKPFDMQAPPKKQNPFLMPLIWLGSYILTRKNHLKIEKNLRGMKPPFLVIATHQGFSDYYIAPLALFPHRANYVSDVEGYAAFGEWLYRSIGCIGKRRFVSDVNVLLNIKKCIRMKQSVVVYPESRHCNAGTTSYLPDHLGQLAKYLNVPVVILSVHGSYLESPFWDEEYSRKSPIKAKLECLYTKDEVINANEEEIQKKAANALQYDEYAWQQENKIYLKRNRANGLHKVLYRCPLCTGADSVSDHDIRDNIMMGGIMTTSDQEGIQCKICGARWKLTPLGELKYIGTENKVVGAEGKFAGTINKTTGMEHNCPGTSNKAAGIEDKFFDGTDSVGHNKYDEKAFRSIPFWYEWERELAIHDWNSGSQKITYAVHIEALPNSKGFIDCGGGTLELNQDAFILLFGSCRLVFPHRTRESVQTEYNYKGKGMCLVLSTQDNCYYIYSDDRHFNPTWIQFVGEYLYLSHKNENGL